MPGLKAALKLVGLRRRPAASTACAASRGRRRGVAGRARQIRRGERMSLLPDTDRILLGPGPSLTAPRVMRAMASPTVSHLDPLMMALLDDVRARLGRIVRAPDGILRLRGVRHGHRGHGNDGREPRRGRHTRARRS